MNNITEFKENYVDYFNNSFDIEIDKELFVGLVISENLMYNSFKFKTINKENLYTVEYIENLGLTVINFIKECYFINADIKDGDHIVFNDKGILIKAKVHRLILSEEYRWVDKDSTIDETLSTSETLKDISDIQLLTNGISYEESMELLDYTTSLEYTSNMLMKSPDEYLKIYKEIYRLSHEEKLPEIDNSKIKVLIIPNSVSQIERPSGKRLIEFIEAEDIVKTNGHSITITFRGINKVFRIFGSEESNRKTGCNITSSVYGGNLLSKKAINEINNKLLKILKSADIDESKTNSNGEFTEGTIINNDEITGKLTKGLLDVLNYKEFNRNFLKRPENIMEKILSTIGKVDSATKDLKYITSPYFKSDIEILIGGGSIRDIYLGRKPKDIDIFIMKDSNIHREIIDWVDALDKILGLGAYVDHQEYLVMGDIIKFSGLSYKKIQEYNDGKLDRKLFPFPATINIDIIIVDPLYYTDRIPDSLSSIAGSIIGNFDLTVNSLGLYINHSSESTSHDGMFYFTGLKDYNKVIEDLDNNVIRVQKLIDGFSFSLDRLHSRLLKRSLSGNLNQKVDKKVIQLIEFLDRIIS